MNDIYSVSFDELESFFLKNGQKRYRASQVFDWIYKKRVDSFAQMTNLNDELQSLLSDNFFFSSLTNITELKSVDGTIKYLYQLNDGNYIESVVMRHHYGNSLCITTQIGCNMGCGFCASGILKKKRNLDVGEMINQVIQTEKHLDEKISHIVVMGIGEPFDNYDNLLKFLMIANDHKAFEIGARHMTVSTCGIVPKIKEFALERLQVNLAISLHGPTNDIRDKLMPINKKYPIEELIKALKYYSKKTNRRATIEYILLKQINDQEIHALALAKLLKGLNIYVNLIPYNEVSEAPYQRSSLKQMNSFFQVLKQNNINATLRKEQGHDINAACGQLRSKTMKKEDILEKRTNY